MSFETLHHFIYSKKQTIYNKLFQSIKNGGYYIECDYFACCDEEEQLCLEEYEYKHKKTIYLMILLCILIFHLLLNINVTY